MKIATIGRWDWLLGSIVLATLASLTNWLLHYLAGADGKRSPVGRMWPAALHAIESPWVAFPLRLAYAIGIPAAALFWQGALTARGLGLQSIDAAGVAFIGVDTAPQSQGPGLGWGEDISWFIIVAGMTALMMTAGSYLARRHASRQLAVAATLGRRSLGLAALEAVYHEVHWAFYREPFVFGWGLGLGSWLGALPVLLETGISLMFWEKLHTQGPTYQRQILVRAGLFVASTQLYLLTQNLWLAIVMDTVVGWLALHWHSQPDTLGQSVTNEAITTIR